MNELILVIIIGLVCLLTGAVLGNVFSRLKSKAKIGTLEERLFQSNSQSEKLEERFDAALKEKETIRKEKDFLNMELIKRNTIIENLETKLREQTNELEKLNEKFTKEFENLANKILDSKSEKFTKHNKENIDTILKPLQEKIDKFEKRVDDTHKESLISQASLRQQIIGLKELNEQMSKEAVNLTKALKGDNKIQGNWGELVLERVLHLPDSNKMIIDSKVSLVSYERFVNEDDELLRAGYLAEHVRSLKKHIEQLSSKNYHELYTIESPDFVLLFVPIEPAFAIAINNDNNLYAWAFEKNIVIVTPATLLATLRTIDTMWNNEKQQQNALEIATQAGRLYDQFVNLTEDLLKLGNQLNTVKGSYDGTMKKLTGKGNLIKKVETIKKLGIKQRKHINDKLLNKVDKSE
jgi:DNA recombination protein RmuC